MKIGKMQHKKPMIEKEPVYDEVGRRIKGKEACLPINKLNPTDEEMDKYMILDEEEMLREEE